jgi:predicted metal-dependent enzyme (double-stranded beta helix superfamily)
MTVTVSYPGTVPGPDTVVSQGAAPQDRLRKLVGGIAGRPGDWSQLVRFSPGQRWYHRLELADDYEIWLLSWLPGQHTGFHDHGEAAGAFAVACGQLSERTVPAGQRRASNRTVAAGGVRSFGSHYVHDVLNTSAGPAVSVHAYSPPLTAMRRYELTAEGLRQVATKEAGRDW